MNSNLSKFFSSQNFLFISCAAIFLLSIFLRSRIDIGADTGFYLDLGQKIAHGKKYYYDFFESNFPISFYFYALQYHLSKASEISPIIISEIVIDLLGIASIYWSASILKRCTIYQNHAHFNLLLISYCLGFFLRIGALPIGEFGTKTSFLLLLAYPYISYFNICIN
jgi:hypothetical protein